MAAAPDPVPGPAPVSAPVSAQDTSPGPAREGLETPRDLPPAAQVDTPGRLGATRGVLLAIMAALLVALAALLLV
jgi:hypothetical protein